MEPIAIATSAFGQIRAGQAASAEGKSAQNIAEYNAEVQRREAKAIEQRTLLEQRKQAAAGERKMSTLEAGLGASGAVTTTGAPLLILAEQASETELENLMIGYEGATQAGRARSQAKLDIMQGKLARQKGKAKATGQYIGAGTTLLTGFSKGFGNKDVTLAKKYGVW